MASGSAAARVLRILTLNLHCWQEADAEAKLDQVADLIAKERVDVVCLQEVGQHIDAPIVGVQHGIDIRADNAALHIVERLERRHGLDHDWAWAMAHLGFDVWEEGVAVLTAGSITRLEAPFVSRIDSPAAINARRLLIASVLLDDTACTVASAHLSWWDNAEDPFAEQFDRTDRALRGHLEPVLLAGDLNVRDDGPGYEHLRRSGAWRDLHAEAVAPAAPAGTFPGDIAGWGEAEPGRIDYVLARGPVEALEAQTVFDRVETAVSDHFGLLVTVACAAAGEPAR